MRKIYLIGGMGGLLLAAPLAYAVEAPAEEVVRRGEAWLGEGSDLGLELAHVIAAGKKGNRSAARRDLELITAEAEARGLKPVWLQAQQWWIRFTLADQPEADLTPALEELRRQARVPGQAGEEAEIYSLWAEVLSAQGQWLMAVKALDRTTQLSLDAGRVGRALEAFLEMARRCREAGHGWRLHQVWVRVDQVLATRPGPLPEVLLTALAVERAAGATLLAGLGATSVRETGVGLQPQESRVLVSAPDRELGRSRFLLTNTTAFSVEGGLGVKADGAGVLSWQEGENGWYVTLGGAVGDPASRRLRLLPGQQMEIYVEHEPGVTEDTVRLTWQDGAKRQPAVQASGTFYFAEGLPAASVVNAGVLQLQAGWCLPLYHEIYHRGPRTRVQNLAIQASAPCRLEIYDHDTGRLLAVDADGDGRYDQAGDAVAADADGDGWPDLVIGDRARALEICAWPVGAGGAGITVRVGLRGDSGGAEDSGSAENTVRAAVR